MKKVVLPSLIVYSLWFTVTCQADTQDTVNSVQPPPQTSSSVSSPQDAATNPNSKTPIDLLNPSPVNMINSQTINNAGIYPIGGQLFLDRYVSAPVITVSSVTVSTEIVTTSLNMTGNKITNVGNGTASSDAAAFGQLHVLQVTQGTSSSRDTTTNTSFTSTNLHASITPTSASSKILVIWQGSWACAGGTVNSADVFLTVDRSGTNIGDSSAGLLHMTNFAGSTFVTNGGSGAYLDSPATTSALTYTIQTKTSSSAVTVYWSSGIEKTSITLVEVQ